MLLLLLLLLQVQFYPWGLFALFEDAPVSRVFDSRGSAHGFSLVIGKLVVFGQTPRDLLEKKVQVYIHETLQPFVHPLPPPSLADLLKVLKVCPFTPTKELYDYKDKYNIESHQVRTPQLRSNHSNSHVGHCLALSLLTFVPLSPSQSPSVAVSLCRCLPPSLNVSVSMSLSLSICRPVSRSLSLSLFFLPVSVS